MVWGQKAVGGLEGYKFKGVRVGTKCVRVGTSHIFQYQLQYKSEIGIFLMLQNRLDVRGKYYVIAVLVAYLTGTGYNNNAT